MDDNQLIFTDVDIELDPGAAHFERKLERGQRVFRAVAHGTAVADAEEFSVFSHSWLLVSPGNRLEFWVVAKAWVKRLCRDLLANSPYNRVPADRYKRNPIFE